MNNEVASAVALGEGPYPNHHVRELPSLIVVIPIDINNEDPTQSKPPKAECGKGQSAHMELCEAGRSKRSQKIRS